MIQSIQVTVDDLSRVGNVIDKIVQAGVTQIDYIGFSFKDATYNSLRAQAYKKAVEDARGQADAIVGATGGFVIGIASLSTNYWGPIYVAETKRRVRRCCTSQHACSALRIDHSNRASQHRVPLPLGWHVEKFNWQHGSADP